MRLGRAAVIPASVRVLRELRYRGMVVGDSLVRRLGLVTLGDNGRFDQIQTDTLQPALPELQRLSRPKGQIDDPPRNDRSTVVNPDYDGLPIPQICYLYVASQRQA